MNANVWTRKPVEHKNFIQPRNDAHFTMAKLGSAGCLVTHRISHQFYLWKKA